MRIGDLKEILCGARILRGLCRPSLDSQGLVPIATETRSGADRWQFGVLHMFLQNGWSTVGTLLLRRFSRLLHGLQFVQFLTANKLYAL